MSAYHRVVSAFRGGETGVPSAADLKVIAEESSIENFVEDLDVLLPRLLQISVTSEDLELRTQIFKCFANLKNALLLRKSVASEKWWRDLETYMPNDFMTDLKKLIDRNDPSWKESWSLVLFLCFNNPSKKGKCLNSVLKTAEYAFKSKNQRAIDTVFEGWLELIEMFASNHTIMDITRIVSLLIKPLISAQLNPTDRLLKVKSWDVIFHQFGPLSVTSNPSSFQSILIPMISNMFLKGNNSLAASYPNECFKIIINLFEKDFPIHDFIAQVIIAIPTFLDFVIDHDSLLKILNRILDSVSSMDENIKAQLTTNMTKFSEKAIEFKFVFNEETIGKLTFLPDIMVEKLSENIVTKLSPVQNKIDQNSEVSDKKGPAELIVESPKTTWTNPLASKSVFMHRLAKAESEKKAKSTCSSIHDLITSSPKTSKIENASQVTPKKEVEKLVSNLTPKSKVVADPKTNSSNGGTLSEIQNISSSPQVTAKTPVVSESKIDANSSFKSESEKNSSITPKLVTPSKIQKISASPQMTPKTPIEKKSPKIQAGVANLTPKSKTPTKCTYFEDDNASDYVVIKPKEKITVLTEHQKEILSQRKSDIPALYQDLSQDTQSIVKEVDHLVTHAVSEEDQRWLLQDENNENVKNTVVQEVPEVASEDKIHQPEENEKMDVDDKIETVNKSGDSMEVNMEKNSAKEPKNGIASVDKCLKPQVNDEKREDDTSKKTESYSNEDKKARKITRSSIPKPITSNKRKSTKKPIGDDSKLEEVASEDKEEDTIPKQESNKRKSTKKLEESLCDDKKTSKSETPKQTNVDDPKLEESEESILNSETPNKRAKKTDKVDSSEELTSKQDETSKQEISNKRKSTKDSKLEDVASEAKEEKISKAETDKRKSTKTDEDPKNDAEGKPKRITRHSLSTQVQENTEKIKISADKKETGENNSSSESISSPKKEKEIEKNDENSESKVQNDTEDENVGTPVHEIKRGRGRPRKSASTTDSKDGSESGKDEKTRRRGRSKSTANETMKPDEEKPEKDHSVDSNDLSDSKDGSELGKDQKTVGRGRRKSRAKETMKLNEDNTEKDQSVDSNDGTDSKDGSELSKDGITEGRGRRKSTAKEAMKANEEKPGKDQPVDSDDGTDSKDGSEVGKDEKTERRNRRKSTAKETTKSNDEKPEKDQSVDSNGSSSKAETNSSEKTSDSDSNEETSSIEAKDKLTKKTQDEESTKNEKSRKRRKSAPVKLESKTKNSESPKVEGRVRRKSASVAYSKIVTKKTSQPNEDKSPDSDKKEPKKSPDNSSEEQNKRNSCSNLSDTPVKAPLEPKALTEPRKRAKKQPESLKRVKKVSNLTSQSGSDGISTSQDEFISSSESTYEPSMDDVECPEDSDVPNATSEDEVDVMDVDSVQNSDSTESAENGRSEPDLMEENEQVDESAEDAVVEETVKTPENSKKRKRDETDTPMQNEVKRPCLAATPGAKPKKKIMEDITKFFPRIDVPKSFSFGSTSLKEEKNPEVSPKTPKSLKEEKIENEVENKQNAKPFRIKEERNEEAEVSVENKDNTDPNGHINFIKKEKDDNEKSIEDKENTEPINETSALSEVSSDSVLSVKAEHEGSESPILPTSSSSSSGMSTPLIFREKRRSIIPEKFGDNWPCGAQKKWVASVPSPGITPTKSNLKNISSVQTETPPNMKKRVSFVNPVVTKGLLYDDRSNSGKLHLQDEQESETSMETDVDTSADDSHMDAQSSVDAVQKSPIVNALSDGSLVAVLVPKSPAVTPIISETPPASDTVQKSPVVAAPPVNSSEPMSVDAVEEITGEPSELADAPRRCDSSTQTDTIPISQLLSKNELVSIFNEFVKSCQIQLVMKD